MSHTDDDDLEDSDLCHQDSADLSLVRILEYLAVIFPFFTGLT